MNAVLDELLRRLMEKPVHEIMREDLEAEGGSVILPGSVPWMPLEDWRSTDVVGLFGCEVRIVAISARRPGSGAFRRMVEGILSAGLVPVVCEPFPQMEAILRRWGWSSQVVGSGINRQELWRANRVRAA